MLFSVGREIRSLFPPARLKIQTFLMPLCAGARHPVQAPSQSDTSAKEGLGSTPPKGPPSSAASLSPTTNQTVGVRGTLSALVSSSGDWIPFRWNNKEKDASGYIPSIRDPPFSPQDQITYY